MKASLQLKMHQQLAMTPQLQQAIRFLQLSTLELQQEIQQALDNNPLLEMEDDLENDLHVDHDSPPKTEPADYSDEDTSLEADSAWNDNIPVELATDSAWEDVFQNTTGSSTLGNNNDIDFDSINGDTPDLHAHLTWQLNLTPMSDMDRCIGISIIDAIDERGYLNQTYSELLDGLNQPSNRLEETIEEDELLAVLHRIQHFDPVGVGAQDLRECLLIQLRQLPANTPWRDAAIHIVDQHLALLGNHDYNLLRRRSGHKEAELMEIIGLITQLQPEPGAYIANNQAEYIIPDVMVRKVNETWRVELNPEAAPKIGLNQHYIALGQAGNAKDSQFIKNNLQDAQWFLKSLASRNDTLLKVAGCICDIQQGFLEHGEEAMQPLILAEIAERVDMHESTISRVTTQKYLHTPRGIFELKYFFSSHVATASGGEASSTAIRAHIKKLIANEEPRKPLSDNKLTQLLEEQGIKVARRTVAKYRESMHIPPSNERKRLA